MSTLNVDDLLQQVSSDQPCGESLESDADYLAMEHAAKGQAQTQWSEGKDADWHDVRDKCLALFRRSHDLHVAVHLLVGMIVIEGFDGLADALQLIRRLMSDYWQEFHPRLDPDDGNDPLRRQLELEVLSASTTPDEDPLHVMRRITEIPICESVQAGRFSLRDILIAKGEINGQGDLPDPKLIEAAFRDTDHQILSQKMERVADAIREIHEIDRIFEEQTGSRVDLAQLQHNLKNIYDAVQEYVPVKVEELENIEQTTEDDSETRDSGPSGSIQSRRDVILTLDRICEYYNNHEPASPVPFLLERVRRLADASFSEIMHELLPDEAAKLFQSYGGAGQEDDPS